MAIGNLTSAGRQLITGNDSIVIVDHFADIRGGRTLDTTGFSPEVINAGHVIIQETSTKEFKPMPVNALGAILGLGTITAGASYTNGTYSGVALTGGSGSGATANITVAGGVVTSVVIVNKGTGYAVGNALSASAAAIGGAGSGFTIPVSLIDTKAATYASLPNGHTYAGVLIGSILTIEPFASILTQGTVNVNACPFPMTSILSAVKAALSQIDFRQD